MIITLKFENRTAEDCIEMQVDRYAAGYIMDWYGAFYAGDDYDVFINGLRQELGINGELAEHLKENGNG